MTTPVDPPESPAISERSLEESADLVSQIARETRERSEEVQRAVQKKQPDFLLEVEHSEVLYTLPPSVLLMRHIDYARLADTLAEKFQVSLDFPSLT